MRPLYLDITAFGPYAGRQEIDFAELGNYRFFLIHGPTGSGKTTLLDAMCYALYGDTSGKIRSGENMRSDYATETEITEVSFDFSVGQDCYRVKRIPRQQVARKRGSGLVEVAESAQLFKIDQHRQEQMLMVEKKTRVTEEIERILGFKSDQFRQVVLLPQGDFRRLLLADSVERQTIMQMLFKTEYYSLVEQRLKDAAKSWAQNYAEVDVKTQELLKLAEVESIDQLRDRTEADQVSGAVIQEQIANAAEMTETSRRLLYAARQDQRTLEEQRQAREAAEAVLSEQVTIGANRSELQRALQAAAVSEYFTLAQTRQQEYATAFRRHQEAETGWATAKVNQQVAQNKWAELSVQEPEIDRLLQEKSGLEELAKRSILLSQAVTEADKLRKDAEKASLVVAQASTELKKLAQSREELLAREMVATRLAAELGSREAAFKQCQDACDRRKKLDRTQVELAEASKRLALAAATSTGAQQKHEQERGCLSELQELWEKEQAALLANELEPGQPCPVCGSTRHPAKAVATTDTPDPVRLRMQRQSVEQAARRFEAARKVEYDAQVDRDRVLNALKLLEEELGASGRTGMDELETKLAVVTQDCQESAKARVETAALRVRLDHLRVQMEDVRQLHEQQEKSRSEREAQANSAEAVVLERRSIVPEQYREAAALQQALAAVTARLSGLRSLLQSARQKLEDSGKLCAQAMTQHEERLESLKRARELMDKAYEQKRLQFAAVELNDEADFQSAVRTPDQRKLLDQTIRSYESRLAATKERLVRAEQAAGQVRGIPDIVAREKAYSETNAHEQELRVEQGRIQDRLTQACQLIGRLETLEQERLIAEEQHGLYAGLHEITSGRLTGVSFERYVLGFLLDEVSLYANLRLKEMTRGRYRLRRREDRGDKRKGVGLDLEVVDSYTGEARPVQTLSGGETFLASLSLALGLADVVQSRAGGIHLETLFVDEGFGTLDPETLDLAIKALIDLQQGGRLVGIISHVPELKESIDARLEIVSTDRGSQAIFHVG